MKILGQPSIEEGYNSLKPKGKASVSVTLAEHGKTNYVIVIPASPTTQERKAAEDLALWLGRMTDAQFPIVSDSKAPIETEISIGQTCRLQNAGIPEAKADLGDEGYAIGVSGNRLFLLGGRKRGPINAVYSLLEEDLSCRWYASETSRIPHHRTLCFAPVPRSYAPKLMIRDPFYYDAFDATWSLRNRTNAQFAKISEEWGGHVDYDDMFVHTFERLVPSAEYFERHSEYYMLIDGKRNKRQLCLTNPDVLKIATENVLRILKEHPHATIIVVSPNDGGGHCTCPQCAALDEENGSPSGSLIHFVNQIAEAVEKEHPGVMVSTDAYQDTVEAPKKVRPRKNVAVRLCNNLHAWSYPFTCFVTDTKPGSKRYREALIAWSNVCGNLHIWDYFVNFSHYLAPMPNMHVLEPSVRFYVEHNVTGIFIQAAYQSLGGEFAPMRAWVMAKLLWDPSRNVDDLVKDFILGYFEEAAPAILDYYQLLEQTRLENEESMAAPPGGIRYSMDHPFLSRRFINEATAIFDRAEKMARTEEILRRVQVAKLPIIYVKLSRGPGFTDEDYSALIQEFETIARREGITHLHEVGWRWWWFGGGEHRVGEKSLEGDLDKRLQGWRNALNLIRDFITGYYVHG